MSQDKINGVSIYNYYTQYNNSGSNSWSNPTFIDPETTPQA